MPIAKELQKAIDLLNDPKKGFGKNHINTVKDLENLKVERVTTGLVDLDYALGGGIIKHGMVEIWGPESSGKTSLVIQLMSIFQDLGLDQIAFLDHEHVFDIDYAEACGVNMDEVMFSQPENGEQGIETAKMLVSTGKLNLLIFDSVAAMKTEKEINGDIGDKDVGTHAKMMGKGVLQLNGMARNNGCLVIWINQIREKIGVMFGSPETTTGGNALKYYCSQRLDIRRTGYDIKDAEGAPLTSTHKITVKKNKAGKPFRKAEVHMNLGQGFSPENSIIDRACNYGIIKKAGSWFSYGDTKIGQGRPAVILFLQDNKELFKEIESKVRVELDKN